VSLTAEADPGHLFAGWTGACTGLVAACRLTVDSPTSVTARFEVARTIHVHARGNGVVTVAGQVCFTICDLDVAASSRAAVRARADHGARFVRWRGACKRVTAPRCLLKSHDDEVITAVFGARS
jgi:hypothetical protein